MPTVPECLQKTTEVIDESNMLLRDCYTQTTELQVRIDYTRKIIAESLAALHSV